MAGKQYSATISIGAVMAGSINSVFGGIENKLKGLGKTLSDLRKKQAMMSKYDGIKDKDSKAAKKLAEALREAGVNTDKLTDEQEKLAREIGDTEKQMAKLTRRMDAFKGVGGAWKQFAGTVAADSKRLVTGIGAIGAAVAGAAAGLTALTSGFVNWADDIADAAEGLGMSTEALQTWQFAASTVGVEAEKVGASFAKFGKTLSDGGDKVDETLGKLGLSAEKLKKLSLDDQLYVVAEAFKNYRGETAKSALAMALFGRSGYKLVGVLNKGRDGLREFNKLGKETGAILDDAANDAAGEAATAMETLGITMTGLRNIIAVQLAPSLGILAGRMGDLLSDNAPRIREWAAKLGTVIETQLVPAMVMFLDKLPDIVTQVGEAVTGIWQAVSAVKDFVGGWENLGYVMLGLNFLPTIIAVGQLGVALWGAGAAAWGVVAGFVAAKGGIVAIGTAIGATIGVMGGLVIAFGAILAAVWIFRDEIAFSVSRLAEAVVYKWDEIKTKGVEVWEGIKASTLGVIDDIQTKFGQMADWIIGKFTSVGDKIKGIWEGVKAWNPFASADAAPVGQAKTASIVPADAMPRAGNDVSQTNNVQVTVNAPGQDGRGIANALRSELQRKPLWDADGVLVPS